MSQHIGVDGCRFGWVAVFGRSGQLQYRLFRDFDALVAGFPLSSTILVDIPIGLPWSDCQTRPCDARARHLLGAARAASVFPAPCRAACRALDVAEARRLNKAELGRSISAQAWGICAKVASVDRLLCSESSLRQRVREIHPEVCFWGLADGRSMQHSKSTRQGRAERLAVLRRHEPASDELLDTVLREERRKHVQADDVLDAIAAYIIAAAPPHALQVLHGDPERDEQGLPMEMLYLRQSAPVCDHAKVVSATTQR